MAKASDLKKGMIVDIQGIPHVVKQIEVRSPSSRGASTLYKVRFNNMKTGQKLDESLKGDDVFKEADCIRAKVQYSYQDGNNYVFMNLDDYSQYSVPAEELEGKVDYLSDGLEGIVALLIDDVIFGYRVTELRPINHHRNGTRHQGSHGHRTDKTGPFANWN